MLRVGVHFRAWLCANEVLTSAPRSFAFDLGRLESHGYWRLTGIANAEMAVLA